MDYLDRAVAGLTEGAAPPSERDLKYAVLHLQAATEVLLKARLIGEHWSLVFKRIGDADLGKYKRGDFESCTTDEAIDRLTKIAQVEVPTKSLEAIAKLAKDRNALMHYGHTGSAYVVEARAAQVLDFLLAFINDELRPMLDGELRKILMDTFSDVSFMLRSDLSSGFDMSDESLLKVISRGDVPELERVHREITSVDATMGELRLKLGRIEKLVDRRMKGLAEELNGLKHRTVNCPDCRQMAFIVNGDQEQFSPVACRFCLYKVENPESAAADYVWRVTGEDNGQLNKCPACKFHALVLGAYTVENGNEEVGICFCCGATFNMAVEVDSPPDESNAEKVT